MNICKGTTIKGKPCCRKTKDNYCHIHKNAPLKPHKYKQEKPEECIVCFESLANQKRSLSCGHWIHKNCIIKSAKAECPICRKQLLLGKNDMKLIKNLAKKREEENIAEEELELQHEFENEIQNEIINLLMPAFREHMQTIGYIFEDIDAIDIINEFFDDESYQNIFTHIIGYTIDTDLSESL